MHGIGEREKRPWGQNRLQENVNSDSSDTGFSDSESDISGCMGHKPKENPTAMKDTGAPFRLMEGTGDDGKGSIRTWTQLNVGDITHHGEAVTTNEEVTPETPQANTSVKFVPGPRTPNREPNNHPVYTATTSVPTTESDKMNSVKRKEAYEEIARAVAIYTPVVSVGDRQADNSGSIPSGQLGFDSRL
ncbi:hypothetical protein Bbelb_318000 [Branchiostoma belcheri]|nr:hypothetical protein Bbelb_318000 [Branchiostoma belcheri]